MGLKQLAPYLKATWDAIVAITVVMVWYMVLAMLLIGG